MGDREEETTDEALMCRFYRCEAPAFEALADRWWGRLRSLIRARGLSPEDADDLAQDTLVRLFVTKERQSFDLDQPLAPFLLAAARNAAIGAWRQSRRAPDTVPLVEELDAIEPDGEELFRADVVECMEGLPEPERTYIRLCKAHGVGELSHVEIGELLGKWPAQMTRISRRSRERLRRCLEEKGYGGCPDGAGSQARGAERPDGKAGQPPPETHQ